jgi:hypothetical protein
VQFGIFHDLAAVKGNPFPPLLAAIALEVIIMNSNSPWTYEAVQMLMLLAREGMPASVISLKLKRPIIDVRAKLNDLGITPAAEA